ncbi:MAG: hypothetical protein HYY04_07875 [Chloroflexi bacterium]|nr:hypothetical protein [Chloroflexota bacterium]
MRFAVCTIVPVVFAALIAVGCGPPITPPPTPRQGDAATRGHGDPTPTASPRTPTPLPPTSRSTLRVPTASPTRVVPLSAGGVIRFCGVSSFAWTIEKALARSAQPPADAWSCLKSEGFTTIVRQNIESDDGGEKAAVEAAGMTYIGRYRIRDQTAYSPEMIETMMNDIVARLRRGERILVHDLGGRGRMGFWEAAFLMWAGWPSRDAIDRYVEFGWKIDCTKGGNGQMQGINEIAATLAQPSYYPRVDSYGTSWENCPRPAYMDGWDYGAIVWPVARNMMATPQDNYQSW